MDQCHQYLIKEFNIDNRPQSLYIAMYQLGRYEFLSHGGIGNSHVACIEFSINLQKVFINTNNTH